MQLCRSDDEDLFVCPCEKKNPITRCPSGFKCCDEQCIHNIEPFPFISGIPCFISRKATDTIFDEVSISADMEGTECSSSEKSVTRSLLRKLRGYGHTSHSIIERLISNRANEAESTIRVLVVGGGAGSRGIESLEFSEIVRFCFTNVIMDDSLHCICDGHFLPYPQELFDIVIIQAVLEHVVDPSKVVSEIHRVLKVDGEVYSEIPFLQPVHLGALDFWRYTLSGHRLLFKNFSVEESKVMSGPSEVFAWSIHESALAITGAARFSYLFMALATPVLKLADYLFNSKQRAGFHCGSYVIARKVKDLPSKYLQELVGRGNVDA